MAHFNSPADAAADTFFSVRRSVRNMLPVLTGASIPAMSLTTTVKRVLAGERVTIAIAGAGRPWVMFLDGDAIVAQMGAARRTAYFA